MPIDRVRVISNTATAKTGILIAEKLARRGAEVTLILGSVNLLKINKKIKVIRFIFFNELKNTVLRELKAGKFDAFIHSAAVSDYRPLKSYTRKVKSGLKSWKLVLVPAEKIIDSVKMIDRNIFLVGFKFEPEAKKLELVKKARLLMERSGADLVVANTIVQNRYKAHIVGKDYISGPVFSKEEMAKILVNLIKP